jgi:hypothetical protein
MRIYALVAAMLFATAALLAQTPSDGAQAVACSAPEYRQFDFWLGDWEVRNATGQLAGTNRIERIEGGCGLQENRRGTKGVTGRSINTYWPSTGRWHQMWIGSDGLLLRLDGRYDGEKMVLEGDTARGAGGVIRNRITWSRLAGGKVRQLWEQSADAGETWSATFDGTYRRSIAR